MLITKQQDLYQLLLQSEKFRRWRVQERKPAVTVGRGRPFIYKGERYTNLMADQKHLTPQELAKQWGVSVQTIREIFRSEEGVLKIGRNGTRTRRAYKTLRIPESVAERVHTRLSA